MANMNMVGNFQIWYPGTVFLQNRQKYLSLIKPQKSYFSALNPERLFQSQTHTRMNMRLTCTVINSVLCIEQYRYIYKLIMQLCKVYSLYSKFSNTVYTVIHHQIMDHKQTQQGIRYCGQNKFQLELLCLKVFCCTVAQGDFCQTDVRTLIFQ